MEGEEAEEGWRVRGELEAEGLDDEDRWDEVGRCEGATFSGFAGSRVACGGAGPI